MNNVTSLFPSWKQAVEDFLAERLQPGQTITHDWLNEHFKLRKPETIEEYEEHRLAFLQSMDAFRETLLEQHNVALVSRPGIGYEVIAPHEQTEYALRTGVRRVKRELEWMASHLVNVDHAKLTNEQRKENADGLARAAMMRSMFKQARRAQIGQSSKQIEKK